MNLTILFIYDYCISIFLKTNFYFMKTFEVYTLLHTVWLVATSCLHLVSQLGFVFDHLYSPRMAFFLNIEYIEFFKKFLSWLLLKLGSLLTFTATKLFGKHVHLFIQNLFNHTFRYCFKLIFFLFPIYSCMTSVLCFTL